MKDKDAMCQAVMNRAVCNALNDPLVTAAGRMCGLTEDEFTRATVVTLRTLADALESTIGETNVTTQTLFERAKMAHEFHTKDVLV